MWMGSQPLLLTFHPPCPPSAPETTELGQSSHSWARALKGVSGISGEDLMVSSSLMRECPQVPPRERVTTTVLLSMVINGCYTQKTAFHRELFDTL